MPDYEIRIYQLKILIKKFYPEISEHFNLKEINIDLFVQKFFISIFSAFFPFEILIKIWDIFLIVKINKIIK
jgi:hypothetical protein